ncbi:MAG TPA: chemotaxis protein CheW [Thermomicrobiales bacterium]|nr:chemotaxis protein CheW [Thermomicrobiales bacterium]
MIATAPTRSTLAPSPTRPDTTDIIRVEIGGVGFALPLAAIATILSPSAMTATDPATGWAGTVPSRGGEIPIADGRTIFDLDGPATGDQRLLILRGSPATGLLVDTIHGTTTLPAGDIEWLSPLFGPVDHLLTQAVAWQIDGALDLVIDVPALRRHLHTGPDAAPSGATAATAALFTAPPSGDCLELRLDDSANRWLLPIDYVRHISDPRPPARLPRTSPTILGLLAWRREPIPLIDTAHALDLPESTPATLIVIGPPSQPDDALLALTITAVTGVAPADSTAPLLDLPEVVRRLS